MLWTSHRGLCSGSIENTRNSFKAAIEQGFRCLETDLRCTKDNVIVLHHDRSMLKTSGTNVLIDHITIDEFENLPLNDRQKGMKFEEFVEEFAAYSWIFDIKTETSRQVIDGLKDWCLKKGSSKWLLSNTRFLVWSAADEDYLKLVFPGAESLAREPECHRAGISVILGLAFLGGIRRGRSYALPPRFFGLKLFKKSFIQRYQRLGAKVIAYLPDRREDVEAAVEAGVDEILTNGTPCI